jgi:hypothetical protein
VLDIHYQDYETIYKGEDTLSECIRMFVQWTETPEDTDFWYNLFDEVVEMEEDFESPTELDFAPIGDENAKIEILVGTPPNKLKELFIAPVVDMGLTEMIITQPVRDDESSSEWWTKVKLFFGKLFYKV